MISSAYANTAPAGPDPMFQILMLVGFIAIFYFLLAEQTPLKSSAGWRFDARCDEAGSGSALQTGRTTQLAKSFHYAANDL